MAFSHGQEKEREGRKGKRTCSFFFPDLPQTLSPPLSQFNPISISQWAFRKMPRPITSLMLFIKATGCELPCPWHLNHGASPKASRRRPIAAATSGSPERDWGKLSPGQRLSGTSSHVVWHLQLLFQRDGRWRSLPAKQEEAVSIFASVMDVFG